MLGGVRVELWCRPLAVRKGHPPAVSKLLEWDDPSAVSPTEAAERAWSVTNDDPSGLAGWMLEQRRRWDAVAGGLSIGVGDVVVAGGVRLRCTAKGFDSAPASASP